MMTSDCPFYEIDCERFDCCECDLYQIYFYEDEENEEENNKE